MNIVIVGAGFTGIQLARRLISEKNEVTLIDNNEDVVRHVSNSLDCTVIRFRGIATGKIKCSTTDEVRQPRKAGNPEEAAVQEQQRLMQLQSKNSGKLQNAEALLNVKESERGMLEAELKSRIDNLCDHQPVPGCDPHKEGYTETQRKLLSDITNYLHQLSKKRQGTYKSP